jgi:hypothetical protein
MSQSNVHALHGISVADTMTGFGLAASVTRFRERRGVIVGQGTGVAEGGAFLQHSTFSAGVE